MTDWAKVFEVFGSGIIGVFLVMIALQVVTQLSSKIIDALENWTKAKQDKTNEEPEPRAVGVKE